MGIKCMICMTVCVYKINVYVHLCCFKLVGNMFAHSIETK